MYPPEGCPPLAGRKRHACQCPPLPVFCPDRPRPLAPGCAAKPLYTLPDQVGRVPSNANAWGHPRVQVSPEHERLSGGAGFFKGRRPLNALLVPFRASEKGPAARGRIPRIPVPLAAHLLKRQGAAQLHKKSHYPGRDRASPAAGRRHTDQKKQGAAQLHTTPKARPIHPSARKG